MYLTLDDLEAAARIVYAAMPPTPQHAWPLLARRTGAEVWVKHENHTAIGAFKIRGGIAYMDWLKRSGPKANGIITATRGNHGQSIALAGRRAGLSVTILVPHGNSVEKNAAMMISAAYTLPYSAQPCAQLTYQPRPDLTPTVSATISVRNDVPRPMNNPMKMFGNAAGIATRKIR